MTNEKCHATEPGGMLRYRKWQVGTNRKQKVRLKGLSGNLSIEAMRRNRPQMLVSSRGRIVVEIDFYSSSPFGCIARTQYSKQQSHIMSRIERYVLCQAYKVQLMNHEKTRTWRGDSLMLYFIFAWIGCRSIV